MIGQLRSAKEIITCNQADTSLSSWFMATTLGLTGGALGYLAQHGLFWNTGKSGLGTGTNVGALLGALTGGFLIPAPTVGMNSISGGVCRPLFVTSALGQVALWSILGVGAGYAATNILNAFVVPENKKEAEFRRDIGSTVGLIAGAVLTSFSAITAEL